MVFGFALHLGVDAYLVLGIPLTLVFQLFVRRERLEELWVRDGRPFQRMWMQRVVVLAAAVSVAVATLVRAPVSLSLWIGAAVGGFAGLKYALGHATRETIRAGVLCLVVGGACGLIALGIAAGHITGRSLSARVGIGLTYLVLYSAVGFVLEEVVFRGAIDSHLHHPGEPGGIASAVLVSALWGLWHLPLVDHPGGMDVLRLLAVHVPLGVVLSIFWRRSGNLAVPNITHAFIDAVRNALFY